MSDSDSVEHSSYTTTAEENGNPAASSSTSPSTSSSAATTSSPSVIVTATVCATPGCGKPATLACPTCLQLKLSPSRFCTQDCFKSSWKQHNNDIHKPHKAQLEFRPPPFDYTGKIRPYYVTPMRSVPSHIKRPEYADNGIPVTENKLRHSTAIHINNDKEIAGIRKACQLGRIVLDYAHSLVRVGITTEEIDRLVHEKCIALNCYPSPLNYHNFPKSCCTSVNEIICHGIPDMRPLQDGDLINIDISVFHEGFHGDLNETYPVGTVDKEGLALIRHTYDATMKSIEAVKPGVYCRDFGDIITKHVNKYGLSVVKTYCGHGVGSLFHGAPNIPHYSRNKAVGILQPGMIFTIEPMINIGTWKDVTWTDDWTSATADGKRSAQFEHTVLVTSKGCEILTARTKDSPQLFWEKEINNNTNDNNQIETSTASSQPQKQSSTSTSQQTQNNNIVKTNGTTSTNNHNNSNGVIHNLDNDDDDATQNK